MASSTHRAAAHLFGAGDMRPDGGQHGADAPGTCCAAMRAGARLMPHDGTRYSRAIARRAAARSPSVEEMNTHTR